MVNSSTLFHKAMTHPDKSVQYRVWYLFLKYVKKLYKSSSFRSVDQNGLLSCFVHIFEDFLKVKRDYSMEYLQNIFEICGILLSIQGEQQQSQGLQVLL
jgi:hypothetical protein